MYDIACISMNKLLTSSEYESLKALYLNSPLEDGDIPSKSGRDSLIALGLACKIAVNNEQGYQAITYKGWDVFSVLD
jgi:hypothetical protein